MIVLKSRDHDLRFSLRSVRLTISICFRTLRNYPDGISANGGTDSGPAGRFCSRQTFVRSDEPALDVAPTTPELVFDSLLERVQVSTRPTMKQASTRTPTELYLDLRSNHEYVF